MKMFHGANLVPEDLETGEYKVQGTASVQDLEPVYITAYSNQHLLIKETVLGNDVDIDLYGAGGVYAKFINGIPTHVFFICTTDKDGFEKLSRALDTNNQSEYVVANFTVPAIAVKGIKQPMSGEGTTITGVYVLGGSATATTQNLTSTPTSIDGYTPKNQKLRQYPFLYLGFNPTHGSEKVFRYENFTNGTPSFKFISEVNPNPTVNIIPQNYRGQSGDSLSDLASLNGYPQLGSKVDVYNSWLAENSGIINVETAKREQFAKLDQVGNTVGLFGSLGGMLGTAFSGGGTQTAGGVGGLTNAAIKMEKDALNYDYYVQDLQKQVERQQILPDQVSLGGSNATLLGYGLIDNNIFTRYGVKSQFAQRIDQYFDMYGYKTNKLKIPNINNRPNWNYVKTAGINLLGDIPEADLQRIKSLFNEGITLWHNATTFLDYSQNNRTT